jgi:hypothetical protein
MGLPDGNADGYRLGSPINFADGLKGKLLVVHGSGDDNGRRHEPARSFTHCTLFSRSPVAGSEGRALGFGVVSTGRPWNLRAAARADDTVSIDCIRGRW